MSETVECSNCLSQVPKANYDSHSAFCSRNKYRCMVCNDVMACSDKEEHMNVSNDRLWKAIQTGNLDDVKRLIAHGAQPQSPNTFGDTALHFAVRERQHNIVSFLLAQGVNVNAKNAIGDTPTQIAHRVGASNIVMELVRQGASLR